MTLVDLKSHISSAKFSPLYVLTGEEVAVMDIYLDKIKEITSAKAVDSVAQVFALNSSGTLFGAREKKTFIVRNDLDYIKQEKHWATLKEQKSNTTILVYANIDKRSKFYKEHKDLIIEFGKLGESMLLSYTQKYCDISARNARELINNCNSSYSQIILELDKLKALAKARDISIDEAFIFAKKDGALISRLEDNLVFSFVEAACKREPYLAVERLKELVSTLESPLGALSLLHNEFRAMYQLYSARGKDLAQKTGLSGWQIRKAFDYGRPYNERELEKALKVIRDMETGIKTGGIDADKALEYLLVNVL